MTQQIGITWSFLVIGFFLFVALMIGGSVFFLIRRKIQKDNETRCRKCRYILRGITEPRCPECGERI